MPASRKKPLLAALATVLLWAFAFPASKAALAYFSAAEMVALRYAIACGFYAAWFAAGWWMTRAGGATVESTREASTATVKSTVETAATPPQFSVPAGRDWLPILALGLLGVTAYQLLFVLGVGRVTAGTAAMLIAANPVFAGLLARVFLRERLTPLAWCGIGVSVVGVALIAVEKDICGEFEGALLLILATLSISVYFVFQKPFFARHSPLSMTAWTSFAGTLPLLFYLPAALAAAAHASAAALWSVVAMGVFSSGIGFVLWLYALSKLPAGTVTSFLFLQPVFVTVMAWFWLAEVPSAQAFAGGAVVLLGVGLILLPGNNNPVMPENKKHGPTSSCRKAGK